MYYRGLLVFISLFCIGNALDLPSGIQKCKRSDSDLNGCLKKAIEDGLPKIENGVPELGLASAQPINVPSMEIGEGKGAVHVVQKYKNFNLTNFFRPKIEAIDVKITDTGFDLSLDTFYEEIIVDAMYDFNGRILVLPMVGQGVCQVKFKNLKMHVMVHGEEFKKKGEAYYEIKDLKIRLKPGRLVVRFDNLFNGDQRLGDEMNKVLNENWKEVWEDVDFAYEETIGLIFKGFANAIFKKIPHERIFPK